MARCLHCYETFLSSRTFCKDVQEDVGRARRVEAHHCKVRITGRITGDSTAASV